MSIRRRTVTNVAPAAARQHSCRALGMREDDAEAACTQLGGAIDKSVQSIERHLEQQPARAGRADGSRPARPGERPTISTSSSPPGTTESGMPSIRSRSNEL
jgi:hypothetical protein